MNAINIIKTGVIGGSGYAGEELIRLLSRHPHVDLAAVSSRDLLGKTLHSIYNEIPHLPNISFVDPEDPVFF